MADREDPRDDYSQRLRARRVRAAALERSAARFAWIRLALGIVTAALLWTIASEHAVAWAWLAAPVLAFVAVARLHDHVLRSRARARRAVQHYERALARLDERWAGQGSAGDEYRDPGHPYAADLDLFGRGSLFELLCAARTLDGERTLAAWLCNPSDPETILARQVAVEELRPHLELREDVALLGEDLRAAVDTRQLAAWAASPRATEPRSWARAAPAFAAVNVLALSGWLLSVLGALPLGVVLLLSAGFAWTMRARTRAVLALVGRPSGELRLLAALLERLERERFAAPMLREVKAALDDRGDPPSHAIARLARLSEWNDSRRNQIFMPLAGLLLLGTNLAHAIERWRREHGPAVARWIDAVARIEALGSLAAYAHEHPRDPFPQILSGGPTFEAEGLGHPLVADERCVRNDVRLGGALRLLLVSGSNMSGKSTLLRSVGINAVLALAGAPVRAHRLALSTLQPGACMRVQDSLQEGISHFYAEILRLRALVELTKRALPVLFLLDEVLHGTNSHDRRIGAEGLIRGLLRSGAVGLVTTHDLALARIADELGDAAANVHFEDHIDAGTVVFDYRLQPGVVQKSNALALMRAVGLDV